VHVFRLGSASPAKLERLLERAAGCRPTYEHLGATSTDDFPDGYRHDRHVVRLGNEAAFDRARTGLRQWQAHAGAGATIYRNTPPVEGGTVLVLLRAGPFQAIAPCRIIYVIDEPDRFALAYGTLPGHPESGEESFVVERNEGSVVFRIHAFSRPAQVVTRLGAPMTRAVQLNVTRQYLKGLARFVAEGAGS
jgi:uncharacterized protein (UPF0548 family)